MGVYIKGMSKPNHCYECDLIGSDICTPVKDTEKPINCPLIEVKEPHGDLVDRNEMFNYIYEYLNEADKEEAKRSLDWETVANAPTVIDKED